LHLRCFVNKISLSKKVKSDPIPPNPHRQSGCRFGRRLKIPGNRIYFISFQVDCVLAISVMHCSHKFPKSHSNAKSSLSITGILFLVLCTCSIILYATVVTIISVSKYYRFSHPPTVHGSPPYKNILCFAARYDRGT
jgi:hypothetical protein